MRARVLLVVGAYADQEDRNGPRRDYRVVADILGAAIADRATVDRSPIARVIRRVLGPGPALAWVALGQARDFDVILADGEHVAIPLALAFRLWRRRPRLVAIGHRLTSAKKRFLLRELRAHENIDRIVVHSRRQYEAAIEDLRIPSRRLCFVPYQVDTSFWSPMMPTTTERLVVTAGLEYRDYPTLLRAAEGLDANVVIGAASNWSRHSFAANGLPSNVTIGSFRYHELRELYARAAVVAVPLVDVDNQAGVTTILEAMAMGKAVVVSQSLGQTDVVEDRRGPERGSPRPRPVSLVAANAEAREVGPTGFYVPPGDANALRRAIAYLLDHPKERERLGQAGRESATRLFRVEDFARRLRRIVESAVEEHKRLETAPLELGRTGG